jgi:drug/metabolite transporter (DMT)-like permease
VTAFLSRRGVIYSFAVLSMAFWGMSFVWTKIVFETWGPLTVVILRMLFSSAMLWIVSWTFRLNEHVRRSDYKWFFLLGFFEPFCYFLGESFGLLEVSASIGALIIATIPVFMTLIAPLAGERWTAPGLVGVFVSFVGVFLIVVSGDMQFQHSPKGILLLFFAVFAALGYNFMTKRLAPLYRPITIVKIQNALGFVFFLPLFVIFELRDFLKITPSTTAVQSLISLTLFASTVAFLMFVHVIAKIGVVRANVFTNLVPVFAALFSYVLLSEHFDGRKIIGMIFILVGVFIAQFYFGRDFKSASIVASSGNGRAS